MTEPTRVGRVLPEVLVEVVDRAGHGYERWAELVAQAGYCHHPIRLAGRVEHADRTTGEVRQVYDSEREPDGVLLKACGTRRESRCPSCAATYRADAYQRHTSVSFTLDRYGHLYPEGDLALRDRLDRFHEAAGDAE